MRWGYIVCGLICLLTGAYLDNCRGPLLPVLNHTFSLDYSQSSWFLVAGYLASICFTAILIPWSQKADERQMTLTILALAFVPPLLSLGITTPMGLVVLAAFLGCTVSGLGSMSNLLVLKASVAESRSRFLCFLHMMYGVGSFLAPMAVGWVAARRLPWMTPLFFVLPFLVVVGGYLFLSGRRTIKKSQVTFQTARLGTTQYLVLLVFALYVAGEVMLSTWMVPFLVERHGLTVETAAPYATGFFGLMALTRLGCFLGLRQRWERGILWGCLPLSILAFCLGREGWLWGLSLAGLMGPFFPLFLGRVSDRFNHQVRPLTLWILTTMQITLAVNNYVMGKLSTFVGVATSYWLPLFFLTLSAVVAGIYLLQEPSDSDAPSVLAI